jgi:hypothetical protein
MHPTSVRIGFRQTHHARAILPVIVGMAMTLCLGCQSDLVRYYPLDPGFTWQYRVTITDGREVTRTRADVVNSKQMYLLGRTSIPQRSEMFGQILIRFLAVDGRGVFEHAQQAGDGVPMSTEPPNYVLQAPLAEGTTWSSTWQSASTGQRLSVPSVKAIAAVNETVMVPAGTFAGCLRLRITGKADVNLASGPATIELQGDEWYAPQVGFIKGTFRETVNGGHLGTTELGMDLESYMRPD